MGFLDDSEENQVEEVTISAPDETSDEDSSSLEQEAKQKLVGSEKSKGVSLEDIHRQNEKIISLLEELTEDSNDQEEYGGGMDGVL